MTTAPVVRLYPGEWRVPIPLMHLSDAINERDLTLEYRLLRYLTETPEIAATIARPDPKRDRYSDMRCYVNNSVTLPAHVDQLSDYYINASLIDSPENE